ncbi:hypothetical protein ACSCBZ_16395 [Streptomyces niveiscabiei]|uniref:hypothetical protein n=1 Tax=Streptomyces niveiscabiei TaxID=164115 RepID=UPI00131D48B5|nr:hypothetical protein [Streptomyces niveiscabiei]
MTAHEPTADGPTAREPLAGGWPPGKSSADGRLRLMAGRPAGAFRESVVRRVARRRPAVRRKPDARRATAVREAVVEE